METTSKNRRIKIAAAALVALGLVGAASFGFIAGRSGEESAAGASVEPSATATTTAIPPTNTPETAAEAPESQAPSTDSSDGETDDAPAAPPPAVTPVPPAEEPDEPEVPEPTVTPQGCQFCPEDLDELAQPEDEKAPVISEVDYNLCNGKLEISFGTDEEANAWITYNDGGPGLTLKQHGTEFDFTITGLAMGTTVDFWVHVEDELGNHASTHYSLFSMACVDIIFP